MTQRWPVENVAAAVVVGDRVDVIGDPSHRFRLASIAKTMVGWVAMVAVEEGTISLDDPVGQPDCTVRHLLAHAGGYGFDGAEPIARPQTRRMYSNAGIEMVAEHIARSSAMTFDEYL